MSKENNMKKEMKRYNLTFIDDDGRKYVSKKDFYVSECNGCGQLFLAKSETCPACGSNDHHDFEDDEVFDLIKRLNRGDRLWT